MHFVGKAVSNEPALLLLTMYNTPIQVRVQVSAPYFEISLNMSPSKKDQDPFCYESHQTISLLNGVKNQNIVHNVLYPLGQKRFIWERLCLEPTSFFYIFSFVLCLIYLPWLYPLSGDIHWCWRSIKSINLVFTNDTQSKYSPFKRAKRQCSTPFILTLISFCL